MLRGVVSQETKERRVVEYCDEHTGDVPLEEEWFRQNATLNPALTGVVRSLLGSNFSYCSFSASHRNIGIRTLLNIGTVMVESIYSPKVDCLQVFYLHKLTTLEMGPTEVLPGSHLLFQSTQYMSHYGEIRGGSTSRIPGGFDIRDCLRDLASKDEIYRARSPEPFESLGVVYEPVTPTA